MRALHLMLVVALIAGCDRTPDYDMSRLADTSRYMTSDSEGEVALAEGGTLRFSVTSEVYRKWDAAQAGIDKGVQARFGEILEPEAPSERTIDAAVRFLEEQPNAKMVIEQAGMSVREFVVTTVALEQEMRATSGRGSREPDEVAMMDSAMMRPDTTAFPPTYVPYQPPVYTPPVYPPIDTSRRRVDTVYVDSTRPRPAYSPWDSLVRRGETLMQRSDSVVRRDTAIQRVRDSIVNSILRRDSLRRDSAKARPPVLRDTLVSRDTLP